MKKILFVDDDPVVLRIYKDALGKHGLQVETAQDVSTVSRILKGAKPDLLVLDMMMPKQEGTGILDLIRAQPELSGLPVVMLSNSYTDGLSRDAASLGPHRALL
jgi:CheY-like chemotaxis protein